MVIKKWKWEEVRTEMEMRNERDSEGTKVPGRVY